MRSPEHLLEPLPVRNVAHFSVAKTTSQQRLASVLAGVMRHAQTGDLPLFAWTLGLPQNRLLQMIATLFPELGAIDPVSEEKYATLRRGEPPEFESRLAWLKQYGACDCVPDHVNWLARAILAAVLGERPMWQDMGLRHSSELSALMTEYFPALHARYTHRFPPVAWKPFLSMTQVMDIADSGASNGASCGASNGGQCA